jgi:shikimate kinase
VKHVILVGLPGAGKSTVGHAVAALLGSAFHDLDDEIARRAGAGIPDLFRDRGEPAFRTLECEEMERALAAPPSVIAAGGGWAAQPGNLETAAGRAVVVHLDCPPDEAERRLAGMKDRPLLAGDARAALTRLAAERAPFYARADARVTTAGRGVKTIAREIVALARSRGGW